MIFMFASDSQATGTDQPSLLTQLMHTDKSRRLLMLRASIVAQIFLEFVRKLYRFGVIQHRTHYYGKCNYKQ